MQILNWVEGTVLYDVFYNALIFLANHMPGVSVGLAVILLTIIVKLILSPLTYKSIVNQIKQKKLQPKIKELQEKYKDDKETQSRKMMQLYKEHKTNPFAGCLLILIQIPIIFTLYAVFLQGLAVRPEFLYEFVKIPETLNLTFVGVDLSGRSLIFAGITGLVQFVQVRFSPAMQSYDTTNNSDSDSSDTQMNMAESIQKSMKFSMPIMIAVFAYLVPAAVALYWTVNNIFTIGQELVIRRGMLKESPHNNEQLAVDNNSDEKTSAIEKKAENDTDNPQDKNS